MAVSPTVRIKVSGGRGPRGLPSGPLGDGSVDASAITNNPDEQFALVEKLGIVEAGVFDFSHSKDYDPSTVGNKLKQFVCLDDFGAVGNHNGVSGADDNQALSDAIGALPNGGEIYGGFGKRYYFSNPPQIPKGVHLRGFWIPREDIESITSPIIATSAIITPHDKPLTGEDGSAISGWLIWRFGLSVPISYADAAAKISSFSGTAYISNGNDVKFFNNTIMGFEWACKANGFERPEIYDNSYDCTNGIEGSGILDCGNNGISRNRHWPYLTAHQPWSDWPLARRQGNAIYLHDVADMLVVRDNFSYGSNGFLLENLSSVKFIGNRADNVGSSSPSAATGSAGIRTIGTMNNVLIDQCHSDSNNINYDFGHTGLVQLGSNTSGSSTSSQVVLRSGSYGDLGRMMTRGFCDFPVAAENGVGLWSGEVYTDANATSGQCITLSLADIAKLQITFRQPSDLLGNTLGNAQYWTNKVFDTVGLGSPEGVVTSSIGSIYRRLDGGASTVIYVKESGVGNTGWIAK